MASGRSEAEFWRQTPASFCAAMRGDAKARQSAIEQQIAVEHVAAQMRVLATAGKLDPLEDWLAMVRPQPRRTAADMIRVLKEAAGRGARMTIRRITTTD